MWVGSLLLLALASAKLYVLGPDTLIASLQVHYDLTDKVIEVPSTLANFGNPPYGSQLVGKAFYYSNNTLACQPIDHIEPVKDEGTPILLADRGTCPFVMKARHAQDAGYKALVVINLSDDSLEEIIMSDNGSGGNLFIPTMMTSKTIGGWIKEKAADIDEHVELKLTFDIEKRSRVHLRIVYSADNEKATNFFADFAPYTKHFNKTNLNFRPHFALWYCIECISGNYTKDEPDCISGGRYCAPDPDGIGEMTGRDIMMEDLREICLLQKTSNLEERYTIWFEYMAKFNKTCRAKNITESCSYNLMTSLGVAPLDIDQCIQQSFGNGDIALSDNSLMRREVRAWMNLGIEFYPAILLNNRTYRGDWEGLQLAQSICAGFLTPPKFCETLSEVVKEEISRMQLGTLLLIVSLALVAVIVVLVLYKAWVKREMRLEMKQQVNLAMSQYYALSSEGSQLADRTAGRRSN